MQEGLAHVCLVGSSTTVQKAKIESSIPRKRGAAAAGYDKALQSFFNKVTCALRLHFVCQKTLAKTGLFPAVVNALSTQCAESCQSLMLLRELCSPCVQVYAAVERHVDWNIVRCLVIAGPGFMKDQFKEYLHAEAVRRDTR